MFSRIGAFLLATLILTVSVGIPIYTHTCEEDGSFFSVIYDWNEEQCSENEGHDACCKEVEKNCCTQETKLIKLKDDYNQLNVFSTCSFLIKINFVNIFKPLFSIHFKPESKLVNSLRPPPSLYGKDLLSFIHVWRI